MSPSGKYDLTHSNEIHHFFREGAKKVTRYFGEFTVVANGEFKGHGLCCREEKNAILFLHFPVETPKIYS